MQYYEPIGGPTPGQYVNYQGQEAYQMASQKQHMQQQQAALQQHVAYGQQPQPQHHYRMAIANDSVQDEEPMYVNAKQYHRILKRREARARLETKFNIPKERKQYLHESRHAHALKRKRGTGGRFGKKKGKKGELVAAESPSEEDNKEEGTVSVAAAASKNTADEQSNKGYIGTIRVKEEQQGSAFGDTTKQSENKKAAQTVFGASAATEDKKSSDDPAKPVDS